MSYPAEVDQWCFSNYDQNAVATVASDVLATSTHELQSLLRLAMKLETERDRLRAELAEVKAEREQWDDQHAKQHAVNTRLSRELAEVKAERDRMREALEEIVRDGSAGGAGWCQTTARDALSGSGRAELALCDLIGRLDARFERWELRRYTQLHDGGRVRDSIYAIALPSGLAPDDNGIKRTVLREYGNAADPVTSIERALEEYDSAPSSEKP